MKRKWRIWAFLGVAVAFVTVLFIFLANREHPDYVRAAKLLPQARKEAIEAFGPLTWDEWRAENGVSGDASQVEWIDVADSIPESISNLWSDETPPTVTSREIFLAESEWFSQIGDKVDRFRVRQIMDEDGEDWNFRLVSECEPIVRALRIGLIGAADDGDAASVQELGHACNKIISELTVEPSGYQDHSGRKCRSLLLSGVLRAAVRNQNNVAVMQSLMTVMDEHPPLPTIREVMAADARTCQSYLEELNKIDPSEIDEWFYDWSDQEFMEETMSSSQKKAYDLVEKTTEDRPGFKRKVGRRAVAALEARHWQVLVRYTELFENYFQHKPGARDAIAKLDNEILFSGDWSYELAHFFHWSWFFDQKVRSVFNERATRSGLELLARFPNYEDLPEELPTDLVFADPFGGLPILYRKTPTGFLIYSRSENMTDGGFKSLTSAQLRREAAFTMSAGSDDWGLVVSYDPLQSFP